MTTHELVNDMGWVAAIPMVYGIVFMRHDNERYFFWTAVAETIIGTSFAIAHFWEGMIFFALMAALMWVAWWSHRKRRRKRKARAWAGYKAEQIRALMARRMREAEA